MSETFADTAPQWASLSAQVLGWRPPEFWQATPAELATALRDPASLSAAQGPTREQLAHMMERDNNG